MTQSSFTSSEKMMKSSNVAANDTLSAFTALQQIAECTSRMSAMMEAVQGPLKLYLDELTGSDPLPPETIQQAEKLLAESPIKPLLDDDSISDILINGPFEIFITRGDNLEKTSIEFPDHQSLSALAHSIACAVGRPIDPQRPLADARLRDGSRVNIIAPPMAVSGLTISIRKFPKNEITLKRLVEKKEMTRQMADFFRLCAQSRTSVLISGGTGTGKTTLLNAISHYIPPHERIITIEDTAELRLQQPHVVRLETKEPSKWGERSEEVNASDLVRNALRMRPDRIIIGEVRDVEAYDMIQALNTGHDGSMTTIHANAPRDAFTRLEALISPRMPNTPAISIRRMIVSALHIVVQLTYDQRGHRYVSSISDIVGMEGDMPTMQDIFKSREDKSDPKKVRFIQEWTGIIPNHPRLNDMMREQFITKAANGSSSPGNAMVNSRILSNAFTRPPKPI